MEAKLLAGLIQITITVIAVAVVSFSFLYTMKKIKDVVLITEFAQTPKVKDAAF